MRIDKMIFKFFRFCFSVNLFINHFYIFRVKTMVNRSFSTQVLKSNNIYFVTKMTTSMI